MFVFNTNHFCSATYHVADADGGTARFCLPTNQLIVLIPKDAVASLVLVA